jgi:hypothetical protein
LCPRPVVGSDLRFIRTTTPSLCAARPISSVCCACCAALAAQGYIARLVAVAKKQNVPGLGLRADLVDLVDLLRLSSVEVTEAIVKWRRGLVRGLCEGRGGAAPRVGRHAAAGGRSRVGCSLCC